MVKLKKQAKTFLKAITEKILLPTNLSMIFKKEIFQIKYK